MEMNIPDKWIILKIEGKDMNVDTIYKVFASWYGGYLNGDSWKINSGINKIEDDEYFYYFYGHSGSCYKCIKKAYGTSSYSQGIIDNMISKVSDHEDITLEIMDENTEWLELM